MWPETSFASVDPLPLLGVLQQCVRLSGLDLGFAHANLVIGCPPSAFGLEPRTVPHSPLSAKRRGSLAISSQLTVALAPFFAAVGLFGTRTGFACDTSSALEWYGLFMCAASVVRVSFYSSCCTKTQKKIHNL